MQKVKNTVFPKVITLGCRLNSYESQLIQVKNAKLDGVIVNTCAVTQESIRKSKQTVRHIVQKQQKPVYVTGCGVQLHATEFASIAGVKGVVGNARKTEPQAFFAPDHPQHLPALTNHLSLSPYPTFGERTRAFVEIQNGCDHACTFCIIPYVRGSNRSLPLQQVLQNIQIFLKNGYKEIVLTGVDIASYGKDISNGSLSLGTLMQHILYRFPTLRRLRLSSLDCIHCDDAFYEAFAHPSVMPYLHLSVQSADPLILKRMKRRHTPQDISTLIRKLQFVKPNTMFSADIITGFPTETWSQFQHTYDFLKSHPFFKFHVFPYSARIPTPAAKIPYTISKVDLKNRALQLRHLSEELFKKNCEKLLGYVFEVLLEHKTMGRLPNFIPVRIINHQHAKKGTLVKVLVSSYDRVGLNGSIVV